MSIFFICVLYGLCTDSKFFPVRRFNEGCQAAKADLYSGKDKPKPSTVASVFGEFLDEHTARLVSGVKKPAKEPYTLYDKSTPGGKLFGDDKVDEEEGLDDVEMQDEQDETSSEAAETSTSRDSAKESDGETPSLPTISASSQSEFMIDSGVESSPSPPSSIKATPSAPSTSKTISIKTASFKTSKATPSKPTTSKPPRNKDSLPKAVPRAPSKPIPLTAMLGSTLPRQRKTNPETPDIDNHHLYKDQTGFIYNAFLPRAYLADASVESYALKLYESHTVPHTYAVFLAYKPRQITGMVLPDRVSPKRKSADSDSDGFGGSTSSRPKNADGFSNGIGIVAPIGSSFANAFEVFKRVFEEKTTLRWEDRAIKLGEKEKEKRVVEGGVPFRYNAPKPGEPTGWNEPVLKKVKGGGSGRGGSGPTGGNILRAGTAGNPA